ncbi:hypothetical protein BDZ91DRAFT_720774 [Kalaharituber pfeilii]|nr:hypothetical protein BDZ91DRAFT_720774 [Kalaharituber pfeilii]
MEWTWCVCSLSRLLGTHLRQQDLRDGRKLSWYCASWWCLGRAVPRLKDYGATVLKRHCDGDRYSKLACLSLSAKNWCTLIYYPIKSAAMRARHKSVQVLKIWGQIFHSQHGELIGIHNPGLLCAKNLCFASLIVGCVVHSTISFLIPMHRAGEGKATEARETCDCVGELSCRREALKAIEPRQ